MIGNQSFFVFLFPSLIQDGNEEEKKKSLQLLAVFGMKSCERVYRHMKFLVSPVAFTSLLKDDNPYIRKCAIKTIVNMSYLDYYSNWETIFSSQNYNAFTMRNVSSGKRGRIYCGECAS